MNKFVVREVGRYDVDVINPEGKMVTYRGIEGGSIGIMPDDTLVEERKVGTNIWINVYHYQQDVDFNAEYIPFPDATQRCLLCFDTEYNLIDPGMALSNALIVYRHAFRLCSDFQELTRFVPYLIRWLRDNDPDNEEVLRL